MTLVDYGQLLYTYRSPTVLLCYAGQQIIIIRLNGNTRNKNVVKRMIYIFEF